MGKRRSTCPVVEAYSDESGHTGDRLFDVDQPTFLTGTLLARHGLQRLGDEFTRHLRRHLGVADLHAKELGLEKIELVADDMRRFLESIGARFVFTFLEKAHVASTKLAYLVLDCENNRAVSHMTGNARGLHIPLAHVITECIDRKDQQGFWEAFRTRNAEQFRTVLRRVDARIQSRAVDRRLKEVLGDVFAWAIAHPRAVLDFERDELDTPNMIAFGLLIDGIHDALDGTNVRVGRFVHDRQDQFGRFMKKDFIALRRASAASRDAYAFLTDLRKMDIIRCDIELADRSNTPGLQLIDIVLWLYRRSHSRGVRLLPACSTLIEFIVENEVRIDFTRAQLRRDALRLIGEIQERGKAMPDAAIARGRDFGKRIEQARLARMGLDLRNRRS